jgi:hypothetical protein
MKRLVSAVACFALLFASLPPLPAQVVVSYGGQSNALDFNYGGQGSTAPALQVWSGSTGTGSYAITLQYGQVATSSGTVIKPFSTGAIFPSITVGSGTNLETVTPTAASCSTPAVLQTCTVTATFTYSHGNGDIVRSGDGGLQEALNYRWGNGGGTVIVDAKFAQAIGATANGSTSLGALNTALTAATVVPYTAIADFTGPTPAYWYPQPSATTILPLPTTLTTTTALASAIPAGSYGTGTYFMCASYVDFMGQEGPCSATFSQAGLASGSFIFTPPAASTGAVGYTLYISLTSGTYALAYKVPLTSTVCTLTTLENVTPACAVTNSTYGQTGATATVTAITVNTSPILLNKTVISTTAVTHGTPNGRTAYGYAPGSGIGLAGVEGATFPFTIGAAAGTTVPSAIGTLNIKPGFFNVPGRKVRVCGYGTMSGASTATVLEMSLQYDSFGQNTAGLPVTVADNQATPTSAVSGTLVNVTFCTDLVTTVAGAGATAGSLMNIGGQACWGVTSAGVQPTCSPTSTTAAVGSLNLASEGRLHVVYTHTTGTDGAGMVLNGLTLETL